MGDLGDEAINEALRLAKPGAFEGDILAAMQGAIFRGGVPSATASSKIADAAGFKLQG